MRVEISESLEYYQQTLVMSHMGVRVEMQKRTLSYMRHGHSLCEYVSRNDMADNMIGKIQGVRVEMTGEFLLWITEKSRLL